MRELLEYMLKREGYRVDCAENGRKAVALVGRTTTICCYATSGWATFRPGCPAGLKKHHPGTVVIMISAYAPPKSPSKP